jgi:hypothetical protein
VRARWVRVNAAREKGGPQRLDLIQPLTLSNTMTLCFCLAQSRNLIATSTCHFVFRGSAR